MQFVNDFEILLVEDNQSDVKLTLRALSKHNLANKVYVVGDGAEALDFIFGRNKYAGAENTNNLKLILLDLKLPKIDGIEVLREMKNNEETRKIPVVILTSSREDRDIEKCYKYGVNSYIVKPVNFEQFAEAVANLGMYWLILNEPPVR
ncbi:MAG: response regulator [Ignavibacteriales bacterium]|nr:response regulator [Ignavibacteriales bacterium]MCF8316841.1 response regulator [Ignavibacteriales bacterium]MCF8438120.1 response regulator [Ignavibacteriales bacterium]